MNIDLKLDTVYVQLNLDIHFFLHLLNQKNKIEEEKEQNLKNAQNKKDNSEKTSNSKKSEVKNSENAKKSD